MKKKMNRKGFTLVEIIVVLVIIAIMAAFAIPAYNGFVERARESEILASGRVLLVAAQTAGQERYAVKGSALTVGASTVADSDAAILKTSIDGLADITALGGTYTVEFNTSGGIESINYTKGGYKAYYDGTAWATSSATAVTTLVSVITVP